MIAFSNKHFYNNELVVFPSCDRDFAIHRHLVSDARYAKGVNLPDLVLDSKPLTEKDIADLEYALSQGVDWVALSFVQRARSSKR